MSSMWPLWKMILQNHDHNYHNFCHHHVTHIIIISYIAIIINCTAALTSAITITSTTKEVHMIIQALL
jgi:hypothetical protein